ncbi:MAG TPA: GNAT family N-acetyltransferase [Caldilineaceae bacterium]|nr:GNAT family N-acetyltransferase [Caldilineaceae bacterium]
MTVMRIDDSALPQVEQLWQQSRHLYQNIAHEDLIGLLRRQIAVLGTDRQRAWGFLCIQSEQRPTTLPAHAPQRAYVRAVALARGTSPTLQVPELMAVAERYLPSYAPAHLLTVYGDYEWLNRGLYHADFTIAEEVQFLALPRLQRWQPPSRTGRALPPPELVQLRPCRPADLPVLAQLDAQTFSPLWHFGEAGLHELLFTSRLQVATVQETLVGYTAISYTNGSAHLARLAIHPQWQGQGFGHLLLRDVLLDARREGINTVMLNTQVHNSRAQQLYRSYGFRPTGQIVPVLAKLVGATGGMDLHQLIIGAV